MGVCISLLPSFVLIEHHVLFFHIYTFLLLFTDQKIYISTVPLVSNTFLYLLESDKDRLTGHDLLQ